MLLEDDNKIYSQRNTRVKTLILFCLFVCLFVFLALQPIVVVFSQPGSGLKPLRFRGFLITHNDVPRR
jgi:hypothetical protein